MGDIFLRLSNWLLYWCYCYSLANMGVHDRQGGTMKEMDEKFIQLYGKYQDAVFNQVRPKYNKSKTDFCLGYQCGFDAGLEAKAQEDDYQDEKKMEDILSRGG